MIATLAPGTWWSLILSAIVQRTAVLPLIAIGGRRPSSTRSIRLSRLPCSLRCGISGAENTERQKESASGIILGDPVWEVDGLLKPVESDIEPSRRQGQRRPFMDIDIES